MITDSYNIREKAQRLSVFYDDLEKQDGLKLSPVLDCIQCNRLTYCCGEKKVLKDISFEIRKGEKIQIVGKNGSGKSTLIKILCGFETEYEGEILINGTNMKELNLATWRKKLAVVFQNDYIFSGTILENVLMGDLNAEKEDVEKIIHDVDILNMAEKKITYGSHELSGGERQKIAIARAILKNSEVLIVDEGANHLDSDMRNFLHGYMKKTEQTVIFVSHDADFNDLAERILYL